MSAVVVYVHGLWLNGWEGAWLGRQLTQQLGCETRLFAYSSVTRDLNANVAALAEYLADIKSDAVHLVGHSMGGSIIVELFARAGRAEGSIGSPTLPPGRIVLLGAPMRGSRTAERLAQLPYGRQMLGLTAAEVLLRPHADRWNGARELGVIAGDLALGFGRLMGPLRAPSDGTVMVEETRLEGAAEHLTLNVSHSGMLFSAEVARQTAVFLRSGRFDQ